MVGFPKQLAVSCEGIVTMFQSLSWKKAWLCLGEGVNNFSFGIWITLHFRDRSLCAWSASTGEFLFARRYCHGGEVTAVDVTAHGSVIVTGSRDTSVLVWGIQVDHDALMPVPVRRHAVEDRVWSVGVSSGQQQVDFTYLRNLDWPSI